MLTGEQVTPANTSLMTPMYVSIEGMVARRDEILGSGDAPDASKLSNLSTRRICRGFLETAGEMFGRALSGIPITDERDVYYRTIPGGRDQRPDIVKQGTVFDTK